MKVPKSSSALLLVVVGVAGIILICCYPKANAAPKTTFTVLPDAFLDASLSGPSNGKPLKRLSLELAKRPTVGVFFMRYPGKTIDDPSLNKTVYDRQARQLTSTTSVRDSSGKVHWWATTRWENVTDDIIHTLAQNDSTIGFLDRQGCLRSIDRVSSYRRYQQQLRSNLP